MTHIPPYRTPIRIQRSVRIFAAVSALALGTALVQPAAAGPVAKGGAWGALGGAVIGGIAGGNALEGAAAGAATGAIIGAISK